MILIVYVHKKSQVKSGRGRSVDDERSVRQVELTRTVHTSGSGSDAVFKCSVATFLFSHHVAV